MRIYIICPVRNADPVVIERMRGYANFLKLNGHNVHYPPDDIPQNDPTGKVINTMHRDAMIKADEVHVFWDIKSSGSHFDLGMAYALYKKIVLVEAFQSDNEGKSYLKAVILT